MPGVNEGRHAHPEGEPAPLDDTRMKGREKPEIKDIRQMTMRSGRSALEGT